ncbi:MAG: tripartite tricarboxylate transporter TctB family protein [Pseudooceanicola sp.]|nr:tripartite tricarboxylate transporter TctB family protein [Pseudooceanicola sp.]
MTTERERRFPGPRRGQLLFALAFLALSLLLLMLLPWQTTWLAKSQLVAQPRFWPAVGLGLMTACGALYLARLPWRRFTRFDTAEAKRWAAVAEYAGWFMAYVLLVPLLGYLPVTLVFVLSLARRLGYRRRGVYIAGAIFALAVVVIFKGFLSVRIPGAAVYEYLPTALRAFFIQYL